VAWEALGRMSTPSDSSDRGLTHVALPVTDVEASVDFYRRYADMDVVHRRHDDETATTVVWLSDRTRPFVIVLIQQAAVSHTLGGFAHLGVGCESRAEVERRCDRAREEGREVFGPTDSGEPVGYWAILADPDGHNLELSHGQEVGLTVAQAAGPE
jgi:catechol 2,3-dioxygenase-like lactoylglutathione lyase family enzyme